MRPDGPGPSPLQGATPPRPPELGERSVATDPLDVNDVIFKGLEIQGIYGRRIFETWYKMAAMLQSGLDVSSIVSHRLPADRFEEAFAIVASGECGKVILDWA